MLHSALKFLPATRPAADARSTWSRGLDANPIRIRVLCVDDSTHLTAAWTRLINAQPDMELAGTLSSADALIATAEDCRPSVIMMDVSMDGRDPLEALVELRARCPDVRTVIYSGRSDPEVVDRAKRAGAEAFVDKAKPPAHLLEVIRRVARGA